MSGTHTCDHWYLDLCQYRTRLKLTCCQWGHRALTPVFTGTWHVVSTLQYYNAPSHMRMPNIHTYPHRYLDYSEVLHKVTTYCSTGGCRSSHGFIHYSTRLVINTLHNRDLLLHMRMASTQTYAHRYLDCCQVPYQVTPYRCIWWCRALRTYVHWYLDCCQVPYQVATFML